MRPFQLVLRLTVLILLVLLSSAQTEAASGPAVNVVLPQFAFGGGWYSALYFTNIASTPVSFPISFFADNGTPLYVPSVGYSTTVSLSGRGSAIVEALNSGPLNQGYVTFFLPNSVEGYGVYRSSAPGRPDQEAVVPFYGITSQTSTLIFDDTSLVTAVAIINPSPVATTVQIIAHDSAGNLLGNSSVPLGANAKAAFILSALPGLGGMVGKRGAADFTVTFGNLAVLGLRANGPAITSIPTTQR